MELRELLTFYKFHGDEIPIVRGSALSALQGTNEELGKKAILKLMKAMDEYINEPIRQLDKPFLMPIEDVFSIQGALKTTVTGVEMFKKILDHGQSLQALKKIAQEHPTACLRAGALMAVLSYLDFFSTGVQRVALSTAANMYKKLPSDAADFVMEAVPLLTNLLQYHDAKVLVSPT